MNLKEREEHNYILETCTVINKNQMEGLNPAWSMDTVFVSVLRCCPVKAEAMV
jgi:hypothetical protein